MSEEQTNELIQYNLDYSIEEDLEETKKCLKEANTEIERLQNIIEKLEKWLKERLERLDIIGYDDDVFNGIELALDKLHELKGSDKE